MERRREREGENEGRKEGTEAETGGLGGYIKIPRLGFIFMAVRFYADMDPPLCYTAKISTSTNLSLRCYWSIS